VTTNFPQSVNKLLYFDILQQKIPAYYFSVHSTSAPLSGQITSCHIRELFLSDVPRLRESYSVLCCSLTLWLAWLWCAPQRSKSQW